MRNAIYKKSGLPVKAWVCDECEINWWTIEFENGASLNVHEYQLTFLD